MELFPPNLNLSSLEERRGEQAVYQAQEAQTVRRVIRLFSKVTQGHTFVSCLRHWSGLPGALAAFESPMLFLVCSFSPILA